MASVHDITFAIPPKPPFPWGTSPFRVRGSVYQDEIGNLERTTPGGLQPMLRRINEGALADYLSQRFGGAHSYDILPLIYLASHAARARGIGYELQVRESALFHATRALQGFSGVVLRLLSHEAVALWLPRISAWYHDFGGVETRVVSPGVVRGVRWGMPRVYVQSWAITAMVFTEHVLTRAGAKDARVHALGPEPDGTREGHPLYRIPFEVRWAT